MATDSVLPGATELREVCSLLGIDSGSARLLHQRSNAVYLLPDDELIVRMAPNTDVRRRRAETSIAVTRWLDTIRTDIALAPTHAPQPVVTDIAVATFWPYCPTPTQPGPDVLGELVQQLHGVLVPPFAMPRYRPLARLREALAIDGARRSPALDPVERAWLLERSESVVAEFTATRFPLGHGLIHSDVHAENVIRQGAQWKLIDWDGCCVGPRELDLVAMIPDHFHQPDSERKRFAEAYGRDLLDWAQWSMLQALIELHSLGSYIRRAPSAPMADAELHRRLHSLRTGNRSVVWNAVS
ncbi:phosphotransferase [Nocardia sp. SYP-A9097]|uniref:phosphotransferase family protein n=1 Tax=Nocardia sp. SYP-A9097 TaxID=2663237 RepID=UPI00132C889E|nr:aminoglycoside phosphotransferase family protein [Nocardia sp. SYP-A9097]MRH92280.1 phosphotransferase [Nocardia sp. SYP-A9097]